MTSPAPSPKLVKSTALAKIQTLTARVAALVPTLTSDLSPVDQYQPGCPAVTWGTSVSGTGNILIGGTGDDPVTLDTYPTMGVWLAPDVNGDGSDYVIQVECLGGGGGGGGGSATTGGGGGGGGEYASENYTVTPGTSYVWIAGQPGTGGSTTAGIVTPGLDGTPTVFDVLGQGLPDGVYAHGGGGGDAVSTGTGGAGGTGSTNTIHYSGGAGGTVASGIGSDDPTALANTPAFWANGAVDAQPAAWYMMCDYLPYGSGGTTLSDFSLNALDATIEDLGDGIHSFYTRANPAPMQVPTFSSNAGDDVTNATMAGWNGTFAESSPVTSTSACIQLPAIGLGNAGAATISAWVAATGGTFGGGAANSWATIASNALGSAYTGSGSTPITGIALGLINRGSSSSPSWTVQCKVGNNSVSLVECAQGLISPSGWNQVVATFDAGALKLYVNGSLAASTTASITSLPPTPYDMAIGSSPDSAHVAGYCGYMSNVWFGTDALLAGGVAEAFGTAPAAGGAGGGASGGSSGAGGNGVTSSGASGGAGGTVPAVPVDIADWTTPGNPGGDGSDNNENPVDFAAGGGGAASITPAPAGGSVQLAFTSGATYCGTDAGAAAGTIFNAPQQGTSTVLQAGAAVTDAATGAKNSMLIIDPSIYTILGFSPPSDEPDAWTVANYANTVALTVFNANPASPTPVILELSYSYDTALPGAYTGSTIVQSIGQVVMPAGAASVTVDLSQTAFAGSLTGLDYPDKAGAIILGPGAAPTFEAYGQPASPAFNPSVYGPGALDSAGNSLAPYLTVTYSELNGTGENAGDTGGVGGLLVSFVDTEYTPVAGINSFPTTDSAGNQWAQGVTGPVTAWNPELIASSGRYEPEPWHQLVTYGSGWAASGHGYNGLYWRELPDGDVELIWDIKCSSASPGAICTLPQEYWPVTQADGIGLATGWTGTGPTSYNDGFIPTLGISLAGVIAAAGLGSAEIRLFGQARYSTVNLQTTAVNG